MVGSQNGPTVWKGSTTLARRGRGAGHHAGPDGLEVRPQQGILQAAQCRDQCARAHHSAVKNAPKNITSEKMNQLMLQR